MTTLIRIHGEEIQMSGRTLHTSALPTLSSFSSLLTPSVKQLHVVT